MAIETHERTGTLRRIQGLQQRGVRLQVALCWCERLETIRKEPWSLDVTRWNLPQSLCERPCEGENPLRRKVVRLGAQPVKVAYYIVMGRLLCCDPIDSVSR